MNFRATSFASSRQALRFSSQYRANIHEYQKQISSGVRLHRPSDDPVSFRQASSLSVRLQELETEAYSIVDSETKLNTSVTQLQATNNLIVRAKTLAQQGIQATSEAERNAIAVEVDGILASVQDISRTKLAGAFLYSGAKTNQEPFEFGSPEVDGGTLSVEYLGSDNNSRAYIGNSLSFDTSFSGEEIFGYSNRSDTIIHSTTGARVGAGTDNMVGRATLQVRHATTTYPGPSGIAPAVGSDGNDTLIGDSTQHDFVINDTSGTGDFGTITLDGGTPVEWSRADTNLEIVGGFGQSLFVDTSAITPGFSGTVDFASTGTLSVDGGQTTLPIDFSESQTVIDSISNTQTHIDTREISVVGDDYLEFPGTSNVFQTLYELSQDLRNTRNFDNGSYSASLDQRLSELGQLSDDILGTMGDHSSSLQSLSQLGDRNQDLQLDAETTLSSLTAADIPDAVLRLQNDNMLLEFTYSITAQIASTSLLDFLR